MPHSCYLDSFQNIPDIEIKFLPLIIYLDVNHNSICIHYLVILAHDNITNSSQGVETRNIVINCS